MTLLLLLLACHSGSNVSDCVFRSEGCEVFQPAGLNCGLAHQLDYHRGTSCQTQYDPALQSREDGQDVGYGPGDVERLRSARCPPGTTAVSFVDPDAKRSLEPSSIEEPWWTCIANGNAYDSSGDLLDVPAGAVCGLSMPFSNEINECEGRNPALGECPDGYRFRWVVERSTRGEDEFCNLSDPSTNLTVRALVFCEVAPPTAGGVGCTTDCPPEPLLAGQICGLHVRYGLFGGEPDDFSLWDLASADMPIGNTLPGVDSALSYLRYCSEHQPHLPASLIEAMEQSAALNLSPQCRGVEIGEDGDCPEGYELQCTSDYMGTTEGMSVLRFNLCWCDVEGSCQGEEGWCDTRW